MSTIKQGDVVPLPVQPSRWTWGEKLAAAGFLVGIWTASLGMATRWGNAENGTVEIRNAVTSMASRVGALGEKIDKLADVDTRLRQLTEQATQARQDSNEQNAAQNALAGRMMDTLANVRERVAVLERVQTLPMPGLRR